MKFKLLLICIGLSQAIYAQSASDELSQKLDSILKTSKLPGFAVSVVSPEKVLYQKGFGFADLEKKTPYTTQTIQNIGSISKTFIGVALMKLVEEGKVSLDTPINDILPFQVIHPKHPNTPILVRHLATHSSGIKDSKFYDEGCYYLKDPKAAWNDQLSKTALKYLKSISENTTMSLEKFMKQYLTKDGDFYSNKNFADFAPGSQYEYSNIAAALAGHVIEVITEKSFDVYSKEVVLDKIPMQSTGWRFEDVDMKRHASLYFDNQAPLPKYSLITYPDGGLLTSNEDLTSYLMAMMQGYYGKSEILKPETFQEMMKVQFRYEKETPGIFWNNTKLGNIGHTGADPGVFTVMLFNPGKKYGILFMTNISPSKEVIESFKSLQKILYDYGEK